MYCHFFYSAFYSFLLLFCSSAYNCGFSHEIIWEQQQLPWAAHLCGGTEGKIFSLDDTVKLFHVVATVFLRAACCRELGWSIKVQNFAFEDVAWLKKWVWERFTASRFYDCSHPIWILNSSLLPISFWETDIILFKESGCVTGHQSGRSWVSVSCWESREGNGSHLALSILVQSKHGTRWHQDLL